MDHIKNKKVQLTSHLFDFHGSIEYKQVPFLYIIRVTIIISLFAALYMLILYL